MTKDDAIKEIDELRNDIGSAYDDADQSPMWYALGMAVEALQERKTGKWITHKDEHQCSICGEVVIAEVCDGEWGSNGIYEYCPYCGTKMEVDE